MKTGIQTGLIVSHLVHSEIVQLSFQPFFQRELPLHCHSGPLPENQCDKLIMIYILHVQKFYPLRMHTGDNDITRVNQIINEASLHTEYIRSGRTDYKMNISETQLQLSENEVF